MTKRMPGRDVAQSRSISLRGIALSAALLAAGVLSTAHGQETEQPMFEQPGYSLTGFASQPSYLDLDAGVAYTDNALLTPTDKRSTGIGSAGLDVDYNRIGSELSVAARGNVDWLKYFDNAYPASPYGNFDGTALWGHPTDLFQWVVRDTLTEGAENPLAAPTLNELETINFVTTGPYLNFHLGSADRLTAYGSFSDTTYQRSPFDSKVYDGGLLVLHALSATSNAALQLDSAHTSFDYQNVASNFSMRTAQVLYSGIFARTRLTGAAGVSAQDYAGPMSSAPLLDADVSRRVSAYSTLNLHARYGYTTIGGAVRSDFNAPTAMPVLIGMVPAVATPGPYKDRLVSLGWGFNRLRTSLSLQVASERERYVERPGLIVHLYDSNLTTVTGTASRQLRPTVFVSLQAYRTYGHYVSLDSKLTDTVVNVSLSKQFRRLALSFYAQRTRQVSSAYTPATVGLATGTYDEDRVGVEVSYDVMGRRYLGGVEQAEAMPEAPGP